jgi:hypothetical protein
MDPGGRRFRMNRSTMLTLILGLPLLGTAAGTCFAGVLRKFLEDTPRIETTADLDRLRSVVKVQMYAALAMIAVLGAPIVIYVIGVFWGPLRPGDFVYPLVVNLLVVAVGRSNRRVERRAQSLRCADPDLKAEYDSIVCVWEKRALPNW